MITQQRRQKPADQFPLPGAAGFLEDMFDLRAYGGDPAAQLPGDGLHVMPRH